MYTLFVIFIVVAAVLMIGIVLIQESKGGGLASNFAYVAPQGSSTGSVMEGIEAPATNPNNLPGFGASQQKETAPAAEAPAAEAPAKEAPAQPAQ